MSGACALMQKKWKMCDHVLSQVPSSPYVGVIIGEDLKWDCHTNKIRAKANSTLAFLRYNLRKCPSSVKKTALQARVC